MKATNDNLNSKIIKRFKDDKSSENISFKSDNVKIVLLLLVAHHKDFKFLDIVDQEFPESRGQHVFGLLVTSITDVGHQHLTLEASAHSVVNTSGLPPVFLQRDYSF